MNRTEKKAYIDALHEDFLAADCLVVTHYKGLTVAEISTLRKNAREAGAKLKVTKNTLTRIALDGTQFAHVVDMFTGPTAVTYSQDPTAAAKAVVNFAKQNEKIVVLGGALGAERLDASGVKALASMPSLDELRAKIIGLISAPATKLASVVQAPAGQLARVVNAHAQKGGAA